MKKKGICLALTLILVLGTAVSAIAAQVPYDDMVDVSPMGLGILSNDDWLSNSENRAMFAALALIEVTISFPEENLGNNVDFDKGFLVCKSDDIIVVCWQTKNNDFYTYYFADGGAVSPSVTKQANASISIMKIAMDSICDRVYEVGARDLTEAMVNIRDVF